MNYPTDRPFIVHLGNQNWQIVVWNSKQQKYLFGGFPISQDSFYEWIELPHGE